MTEPSKRVGRFALLIGTHSYDDPKFSQLSSAQRDIFALGNILRSEDRGRFQVEYSNNDEYQDLRTKIIELTDNRESDDFILLYYSGHGVPLFDDELLLTAKDTEFDSPKKRALSANELKGWLNGSRAKRQVVILDCCHSGAFAQKQFKDGSGGRLVDVPRFEAPQGYGRFVITASKRNQVVIENPDGLSILTGALVDGLNGAAAPDSDVITVQRLYEYAYLSVTSAAEGMSPTKEITESAGDLHIAFNRSRALAKRTGEVVSALGHDDYLVRLGAAAFIGQSLSRLPVKEAESARKALQRQLPLEAHPNVAEMLTDVLYKRSPRENLEGLKSDARRQRNLRSLVAGIGLFFFVGFGAFVFFELRNAIPVDPENNVEALPSIPSPSSSETGQTEFEKNVERVGVSQVEADQDPLVLEEKTPNQHSFQDCRNCPEMVLLPSGSATVGSPSDELGRELDEGPIRRIEFPSFAISKFEITYKDWSECVSAGACEVLGNTNWERGRHPVVLASWHDAQSYVLWLRQATGSLYRLPSEAEWEYAARAGANGRFTTGDRINVSDANFGGSVGRTVEVGTYPPNAWGLHDIHGNASEWTDDCWHASYRGAPRDARSWQDANCKYGVVRGGAYKDKADHVRLANRSRIKKDRKILHTGFRVVKTLKDPN